MKYPALEVRGADGAFALAAAADHAPTAAEERDDRLIIFFTNPIDRDRARASIAGALPQAHLAPHEVDDGDWARRSQEPLNPVTVGRIVVAPPGRPEAAPPGAHLVLIQPSTGFGTGHHATTRLCLAGLQRVPLEGRFVLDIGTGSGVLAIAARRLGARAALGVDWDPDAVRAARENVSRNPDLDHVRVELGDLTGSGVQGPADGVQPGTADVVTAARRR
jgi:ribosomal protein L11 methyltransferase